MCETRRGRAENSPGGIFTHADGSPGSPYAVSCVHLRCARAMCALFSDVCDQAEQRRSTMHGEISSQKKFVAVLR